jgi:hypothetical protein
MAGIVHFWNAISTPKIPSLVPSRYIPGMASNVKPKVASCTDTQVPWVSPQLLLDCTDLTYQPLYFQMIVLLLECCKFTCIFQLQTRFCTRSLSTQEFARLVRASS